jgi:predicted 3-demethylubiquinone-9 3-methyltransferase (glyoxalase superfamily)
MQKITPNLWFKGNAEEAVDFYLSVFPEGNIITKSYYPIEGLLDFQKSFAGKVLAIYFELSGQEFVAINAGNEFTFNEAVSFNIACKDQAEIDYYWDALTKNGGEESVCGWCKDKYGLSWQINPEHMEDMMLQPGAWEKLLQMKKIDIATLQHAFEDVKATSTGFVHTTPKDVRTTVHSTPRVLEMWNNLTPLAQNEWICYVTFVKKPETRKEHLRRLCEDLLKGKKRPCCWPGCPHRRPNAAKWFQKKK